MCTFIYPSCLSFCVCMCVPLVCFYASSFRSMSFLNFKNVHLLFSYSRISLYLTLLSFSFCFSRFYGEYKDFFFVYSVLLLVNERKKKLYNNRVVHWQSHRLRPEKKHFSSSFFVENSKNVRHFLLNPCIARLKYTLY